MSDAVVDVAAAPPSVMSHAAAHGPAANASARLLRNILMLAGGQLASWLLGIAWLFVVPRKLGAAAIGEFVIAMSIASVLGMMVAQGTGPLLTREIARNNARTSELVGGAIVMRLALTLPSCLGMLVYIRLAHFDAEITLLIWLATALMLVSGLSGTFGTAFAGLERMEFIAYAGLVGNSLVSLLSIALVLLGGRVVALMVLDLGLAAVVLVLNVLWARGVFGIAWHGATRVALYILRAGLSFWIGRIFFTTYLWIDAILLAVLVPAKVVGWYGVPTQLFASLLMVATVLCTAWFPRIAAAHAAGTAPFRKTARPAVEASVVLSLPIATGTALVAAPLVMVLCGSGFAGAVPVLGILAICIVPTFVNMMADQILVAEGRQISWIKVVAIATAINIASNLVLIPMFQGRGNGAVGAAISLLGTEIFELGAALLLLPWVLGRDLFSRVARAAVATALMAVIVIALSPAGLFPQVAAGMLAFVCFALLLRVPSADQMGVLRELGVRLRSRLPGATI